MKNLSLALDDTLSGIVSAICVIHTVFPGIVSVRFSLINFETSMAPKAVKPITQTTTRGCSSVRSSMIIVLMNEFRIVATIVGRITAVGRVTPVGTISAVARRTVVTAVFSPKFFSSEFLKHYCQKKKNFSIILTFFIILHS